MGVFREKCVTTYLVNFTARPQISRSNFSLALPFILQSNFPKATTQNVVAYGGGR